MLNGQALFRKRLKEQSFRYVPLVLCNEPTIPSPTILFITNIASRLTPGGVIKHISRRIILCSL